MLGRCPWESLDQREAERLQAVLTRVATSKTMEEHDFVIPGRGRFRAWIYFAPLPTARIAMLIRQTPAEILLLTPREREICALLADGKSSLEIAKRLHISRNTVDAHRGRIADRLGFTRKALNSWCGHFRDWL